MDYISVGKEKVLDIRQAKAIRFEHMETGEIITISSDEFLIRPKGSISPNQRAAADLMKIAEELSDIAHRLFVAGGADGIDERLRGNLESKAEAVMQVSSDILNHID